MLTRSHLNICQLTAQIVNAMKRTNIEENNEISIKEFLKCLLSLSGLRKGRDYIIKDTHLYIIKHPQRGKVVSILKESYPQYSYYWDSPKLLMWF